MKLRYIAFALLTALLLTGCNSGEPTDTADTADAGYTPLPPDTVPEEPEVPAVPDVLLAGEGAPQYTIIRSDEADQTEVSTAVFLRKYLDKCGVKAKVSTDWEKNPVSEYEIVVGDTLRDDAEEGLDLAPYLKRVGQEGFVITVAGSRIYITGGSVAATQNAVEYFLTEFFGYSGDPDSAVTAGNVSLPGDYFLLKGRENPITSLSLGDKNLARYRLAWDDALTDEVGQAAAETIQQKLFHDAGVWLGIAGDSESAAAPVILLSGTGEKNTFSAAADNGNLILLGDSTGIDHMRGFARLYDKYIRGNTGEVKLAADLYFEAKLPEYITYRQYGAKGDGKTNDIAAIIKTHDEANKIGVMVCADPGATYYISAADKGATVRTDTDWSGASFIIDDTNVGTDKRGINIFTVSSAKATYNITDKIKTVQKGQAKLNITLPEDSIIVLTDSNTKRYIREGINQNKGSNQTDIIVVDKNGNIDQSAPVAWDYKTVTNAGVIPMDETTMTIRGGTFTTLSNQVVSTLTKYYYYARGIKITRSNVVFEDVAHYVENEMKNGSCYTGFLSISDCANITVRDCIFTAHKKVAQGTYDINPSRVNNLTFENCIQTTDILDTGYWGVMGSNFCKNITLKNCTFSRFDAHQGVVNVTIIGSKLGHQCLNAIGSGTLWVEDTVLYGSSLINLRSDYGSTWEGDAVIKNCTWVPNRGGSLGGAYAVFGGSYSGFWDFGYECYMPKNITIENLYVDDSAGGSAYKGIYLLGNIIPSNISEAYDQKVAAQGYVYHVPEKVTISGFSSASGKKWILTPNEYMYRKVEVVDLDETE